MKNRLLAAALDGLNGGGINHSIRHTGLFGYPALSHPEGLAGAAQTCIKQATELVTLVCNANSDLELSKTIKRVDTISDVLCSVLDTSEFIRNVHPDERFVAVANDVSMALHNFLSQLNTHPGLYSALCKVVQHPTIAEKLSSQEKKVAALLLQDFEKSGVHMPLKARNQFIKLNDQIQTLGQEFSNNSSPSQEIISFQSVKDLQGVPQNVIDLLVKKNRHGSLINVPTSSEIAPLIMRTASKESTRRQVFYAMNSSNRYQRKTLEEMLRKRGELANLLGKKSYAEFYLSDKMVETPDNVCNFLESLAKTNRPEGDKEVRELEILKKLKSNDSSPVQPWDRYYYGQFFPSAFHMDHDNSTDLASYFSVGTTFQGLSDIFTALYGIRFEMAETIPGEIWHDDVRKLSVIHETEGLIGTIYCDLFKRDNLNARKYEHAAHFTVRCSRRIDNDEAFLQGLSSMKNKKHEKNFKDASDKLTKTYQLPVVVLVTSFNRPWGGRPGLLELHDIETLFHEMGHAMHSMLSQTDFQHISGTRVVMDFVEVPSVLMEYFSSSEKVLQSFGKHYKTGEKVPMSLLKSKLSRKDTLQALEVQNQIQMALLDQRYHSHLATMDDFDTTLILYGLSQQINSIPTPQAYQWQVQFSHLFSYGSSYYSYLWCRKWASRIHTKLFKDKPVSEWRSGGELLRRELLGVGGGRDPWIGLEKLKVTKRKGLEGSSQVF